MRNKGNWFVCVGLLFIAAALFLADFNIMEARNAEKSSNKAVTVLEEKLIDTGIQKEEESEERVVPDYVLNPYMDMATETIEGKEYIGILQIPSLKLSLPIIGDWSYENLKVAPCRYHGTAYTGSFSICAHNYQAHFGNLSKMQIGDSVMFTDMDGNEFAYEVIDLETISGTDTEAVEQGEGDLILFTCTINGQNRIVVRCELQNEGIYE